MSRAVTPEVLGVLRGVEWCGNVAKLPREQLDRKLYLAVNKVLSTLGGKWTRRVGGHVFEHEQADALDAVIDSGVYVDPKAHFGFFETPDALADEVVAEAQILVGRHRVLEPSAGGGQLIQALLRAGVPCGKIDACEIDRRHHRHLEIGLGVTVIPGDFLGRHFEPYPRVVMNPPYARQVDIDHVRHAYEQLDDHARLVALMSAGWTFRDNAKSERFRQLVKQRGHHRELPEGSFRESGTMVRTTMVVLNAGGRTC